MDIDGYWWWCWWWLISCYSLYPQSSPSGCLEQFRFDAAPGAGAHLLCRRVFPPGSSNMACYRKSTIHRYYNRLNFSCKPPFFWEIFHCHIWLPEEIFLDSCLSEIVVGFISNLSQFWCFYGRFRWQVTKWLKTIGKSLDWVKDRK